MKYIFICEIKEAELCAGIPDTDGNGLIDGGKENVKISWKKFEIIFYLSLWDALNFTIQMKIKDFKSDDFHPMNVQIFETLYSLFS